MKRTPIEQQLRTALDELRTDLRKNAGVNGLSLGFETREQFWTGARLFVDFLTGVPRRTPTSRRPKST